MPETPRAFFVSACPEHSEGMKRRFLTEALFIVTARRFLHEALVLLSLRNLRLMQVEAISSFHPVITRQSHHQAFKSFFWVEAFSFCHRRAVCARNTASVLRKRLPRA